MQAGGSLYPLFRVGEEQACRVVEPGKDCYRNLGGSKRRPTFKQASTG
jgi:hypothetical protein